VRPAVYIVMVILIWAFALARNFGIAGRDVAPHIDATAIGLVLIFAPMIVFVIANFRRRRS